MPEGDTAYRVAKQLRSRLAGKKLIGFQVRTAALATADLRGETVDDVVPYGKHLFIVAGGWALHSHMLMDGTWHLYAPGARWRRPSHQARVILDVGECSTVGFLIGQLRLVRAGEEGSLVGYLGPDPLKPEWEEGGFERAVEALHADPRAIHVALLDQRNVAGFGNEYANEICFLTGVDPATPACAVDAEAALSLGARLIRANRNRVERTTTGNTRPGRRLHVYGRAGRPCWRCGSLIKFTRLGADPSRGRHVYWCPRCQPFK